MFLHGNSDRKTYSLFFSHLSDILYDKHGQMPIFGSDEEKAMKQAIDRSFRDSQTLGCMRHLQKNLNHNLADKVGLTANQRAKVCEDLFKESGKGSKSRTLTNTSEAIDSIAAKTLPGAATYIERIKPQLLINFELGLREDVDADIHS